MQCLSANIENTKGWFWQWKKTIDSMIGSHNPYNLFMTNSEDTNGSNFIKDFFSSIYFEYLKNEGKNHKE